MKRWLLFGQQEHSPSPLSPFHPARHMPTDEARGAHWLRAQLGLAALAFDDQSHGASPSSAPPSPSRLGAAGSAHAWRRRRRLPAGVARSPHGPGMAALRRLAAGLQDPRKVAAFQRLCGVEAPPGDAKRAERPNGVRRSPGAGAGWGQRAPRRNSLSDEDLRQAFAIRRPALYYLFSLGTELGNELFYILFFPFCIWNWDAWLGRRLIILWVWVMYLGQCTKDMVRWPRPASPPVLKLEVFYNSEYSMPSTHAMSGTAIPLALVLLSYGRWQVTGPGLADGGSAPLKRAATLSRLRGSL